jgi:hypothetical protein
MSKTHWKHTAAINKEVLDMYKKELIDHSACPF